MLFVYGKRKPFFFHTHAWADALAMWTRAVRCAR